jgi:hypothetical protein
MSEWLNAHFDIFLCLQKPKTKKSKKIKTQKTNPKTPSNHHTKPCKGAISSVGYNPTFSYRFCIVRIVFVSFSYRSYRFHTVRIVFIPLASFTPPHIPIIE